MWRDGVVHFKLTRGEGPVQSVFKYNIFDMRTAMNTDTVINSAVLPREIQPLYRKMCCPSGKVGIVTF